MTEQRLELILALPSVILLLQDGQSEVQRFQRVAASVRKSIIAGTVQEQLQNSNKFKVMNFENELYATQEQ